MRQLLTVDDLRRILREAAGETEDVDLDGDIADKTFDELGYDSLALLETGGRIERELGIRLEDSAVSEAGTVRALLRVVNERLTTAPAA